MYKINSILSTSSSAKNKNCCQLSKVHRNSLTFQFYLFSQKREARPVLCPQTPKKCFYCSTKHKMFPISQTPTSLKLPHYTHVSHVRIMTGYQNTKVTKSSLQCSVKKNCCQASFLHILHQWTRHFCIFFFTWSRGTALQVFLQVIQLHL